MARDPRRVLDAVLDGVVVIDAAGDVEQLNVEACRILGSSTEAVSARPVEQLPGGAVLARLARAVLAHGRAATEHELLIERPSGPDLLVDVAASPLFDDRGRCDGAVVLLRDRSIGKVLREFWSERARMEAFARIAAGIAHEVKNPLGGIRGAAELLAARAGDAKARETAELIVREVDRITTLVEDLNRFTQVAELRLDASNLHRVLDDVLDLLAMDPLGGRTKVERRFDPSIPELLADTDRLAQVFLNLIRNALEAMAPEGGTLRITTRMNLDHRLDSGSGGRVPTVLVEIEDTGRGIPAELLGQVTTPFVTTKRSGSGLGLAVAQHFVALHGGALQLESRREGGTRARVALPLRRNA